MIEQQCENLLDDKVQEVIVNLQSIKPQTIQAGEAKEKAINYYIGHEDRMMYKSYRVYRDQGYMIGSCPIETAHRSVLQQRMKLSGQRWSEQGVQAIANLRCYRQADQWHIVQKVVNVAA